MTQPTRTPEAAEREAFQEWARNDGYDFSRDHDGDYVKPDTWEAFEGFKAGVEWQRANALHVQAEADEQELVSEAYWPILEALERQAAGSENEDAGIIAAKVVAKLRPYLATHQQPAQASGEREEGGKLADGHLEAMIYQLDDFATEHDRHTFGLPISRMDDMLAIVRGALTADDAFRAGKEGGWQPGEVGHHTYATDALQDAFRARLPGLNVSNAATLAYLAVDVIAERLSLPPYEMDRLQAAPQPTTKTGKEPS